MLHNHIIIYCVDIKTKYLKKIDFDFSEALAKYRSKNGALPTSIIVYRDGVGEGQISHVHKTEVRLLQVCFVSLA